MDDEDDDWWTTAQVATHMGIGQSTLRAYVARGQFPSPDRRIGRLPVWRPATVRAHVALRAQARAEGL